MTNQDMKSHKIAATLFLERKILCFRLDFLNLDNQFYIFFVKRIGKNYFRTPNSFTLSKNKPILKTLKLFDWLNKLVTFL